MNEDIVLSRITLSTFNQEWMFYFETLKGNKLIHVKTLKGWMFTIKYDLDDEDYTPTTLFVGMEVLNDLRNIDTFVEANKVGNTDMLQKGFLGNIFGLNVLKFSTNAAPSTAYSKYAYVTDRDHAYMIAEKRPVTVENFDLPVYEMSAANITQRIVVDDLRSKATCKITTE